MAHVLIRGLDVRVVRRLRDRAGKNGRSLEAELRDILERASESRLTEAKILAARLRRRLGNRTHTDSGALVSEDRRR